MPADIAVDSISNYQIGELNRLKSWLYITRGLKQEGIVGEVSGNGEGKGEKGSTYKTKIF